MRYLRTNTAVRITVGPFLDKSDGITPETALTATNEKLTLVVDDSNVPTLVIDANATASGGNNDFVHITGDDAGFYDLELTAAQTNYLGRAMLSITYATDHCPVFHEFMILPAMIYDSFVLGTDRLDTNVTHIGDTSQTARDIGASVLLSSGTGTGQLKLASGYVAMTWADIASPTTTQNLSGTTIKTATDVAAYIDTEVAAILAAVDTEIADIQARLPAALTADGNIKADSLRISGSATAADNAEVIFDTDYASIYNATAKCFLSQLDDGVTHGGTTALLRLGSSTSTPAFYATNSAGDAFKCEVTAGTGHGGHFSGRGSNQGGIFATGTSSTVNGIMATGNSGGAGMKLTGGATGSGLDARAGATSGYGALFLATGDAEGLWVRSGTAATTAGGILVQGYGTNGALNLTGFNSNPGLYVTSAGTAASFVSSSSGDGILATGAGSGFDINADIHGTIDTVTTYTGNTPQTGDSFARIGATGSGLTSLAPSATALSTAQWTNTRAGYLDNLSGGAVATASALATVAAYVDTEVAAILAAVDTEVASIASDVTTLLSRLGTPSDLGSGATISANLVDIESQTDDIGVAGAGLTAADDAILAAIAALNNITAASVWAAGTRTLTAGTNIALAKGTGVTGFNDLDAAGVRTAVGLATANLDTQLDALPTNAELATALGTADDAVLAAIAALNNLSEANVRTALGMSSANLDTQLSSIATNASTAATSVDTEIAAIQSTLASLFTTALTESYAADGAAVTLSQGIYEIMQQLGERSISGTTGTVKKRDGSTTAFTQTFNDSVTPTAVTRA